MDGAFSTESDVDSWSIFKQASTQSSPGSQLDISLSDPTPRPADSASAFNKILGDSGHMKAWEIRLILQERSVLEAELLRKAEEMRLVSVP